MRVSMKVCEENFGLIQQRKLLLAGNHCPLENLTFKTQLSPVLILMKRILHCTPAKAACAVPETILQASVSLTCALPA
jgi:hypothetical protein